MSKTFSIRINQTESKESIEKKIVKMKGAIDFFKKEGYDKADTFRQELDQILAFYYSHCDDSEIEASKKFPELFRIMKDMKNIEVL